MLVIKPHRFINAKTGTDVMKWEVWQGDEWLATFRTKEDAEAYVAERSPLE